MTEQELLLTSLCDCRRVDLYLKDFTLPPKQGRMLQKMLDLRKLGEPIQYILGECEFLGLKFVVDKRVLIPRPETEMLVDLAVSYSQSIPLKQEILDLGTGSGNISIALAKYLPKSFITSVDISQDALEAAYRNACLSKVKHRLEFIHQGFKASLNDFKEEHKQFDMIISNPPYVPTQHIPFLSKEVQQEPKIALDGGEDGLKYFREIIPLIPSVLKNDGYLFLEFGDGQANSIMALLSNTKEFRKIEILKDLSNTDRFLVAQR